MGALGKGQERGRPAWFCRTYAQKLAIDLEGHLKRRLADSLLVLPGEGVTVLDAELAVPLAVPVDVRELGVCKHSHIINRSHLK